MHHLNEWDILKIQISFQNFNFHQAVTDVDFNARQFAYANCLWYCRIANKIYHFFLMHEMKKNPTLFYISQMDDCINVFFWYQYTKNIDGLWVIIKFLSNSISRAVNFTRLFLLVVMSEYERVTLLLYNRS